MILSFDAEANSLHGLVFAVGAVLMDGDRVVERFFARCPIAGTVDPWVRDNVLPALVRESETHATPRAMRDDFWAWLTSRMVGATVVVDCGWPVEAGLLSACVADDPSRAFKGPYPLHEVASLLLAAGLDPLASYADALLPGTNSQKHHPTYDAHVSALCAHMAMARIRAADGGEPSVAELARVAFEAYGASTGGKTWDGKDIPPFEVIRERTPHVARAWEAAADAARKAVKP